MVLGTEHMGLNFALYKQNILSSVNLEQQTKLVTRVLPL